MRRQFEQKENDETIVKTGDDEQTCSLQFLNIDIGIKNTYVRVKFIAH